MVEQFFKKKKKRNFKTNITRIDLTEGNQVPVA